MNEVTRKIYRMAEADDIDLQCSALRILSELNVREKKVVSLFKKCLQSEHSALQYSVLDGLARNPHTDVIDDLFILLRQGRVPLQKIEKALIALGKNGIIPLKKYFEQGNNQEKKYLVSILCSTHTKAAYDYLTNAILNNELDVLKHICFSLKESISRLAPQQKKTYYATIKSLIQIAKKRKNTHALISYVILLGYLALPESKKLLFSFLPEEGAMKRHALLSLLRLKISGSDDELAAAVFPLLYDRNPYVVQYATEILKNINIPKTFNKRMLQLVEHRDQQVQSFAIQCLGEFKSGDSLPVLLRCLDSQFGSIREAAVQSLERIPQAVPLLLKRIETVSDMNTAIQLSVIFAAHKKSFTKDKFKKIYNTLESLMLKNDERYKVYSTILRRIAADFFYTSVLDKIRLLRNKGKIDQALLYVQLLQTDISSSFEVNYEKAILYLKRSAQDISFVYRSKDKALDLFNQIITQSNDLLKRLKKEKCLAADDLFYLGFHFSEKLFVHKEFGITLLQHIIKKYPRSKLTPKAKKKLIQCGVVVKEHKKKVSRT